MKRLAILQSNYIPWRGYFDLIDSVDEFMLYDVADYTKNDWRNRNRIKTQQGPLWLTIPVLTKGRGRQSIAEVEILDRGWTTRHLKSIRQSYRPAPHFDRYDAVFADLYAQATERHLLTDVNRLFLTAVCAELGVTTPITDAADHSVAGDPTARLVQLCTAVGATHYVSGPAAKAYIDTAQFAAAGIILEYFSYDPYDALGPYPQLHGAFLPAMSIIDSLFNMGPDAKELLMGGGL